MKIIATLAALFIAGCSTQQERVTEWQDGTGTFSMGLPVQTK